MAIQATFTADTRPLEAGLDRAAAKIASTRRVTEETSRSLKAMGSSFDGTKTEGTALRLAASIQKVGGAVRLTDAEWKRADRTVSDVLQKYERMGTVAPAAIQALRRELDSVRASATSAGAALNSIGGSGAARGGLGGILGGLGLGVGAGLGLGALATFSGIVKDLASDAARLTPLAQSFDRLQGGSANAEASILKLRTATRGLVSDADLMQAANKGSLLGLDAMGIKFEEVASVATVLGRAMGQDAAKSVDDLTTALSRMSPQILDNLGIKVDLTAATEAYAKSVGTSADKLSEEQKKRAFATAAMEAARAKAAELGEVQLTVAEQSERIAVGLASIATQAISAGDRSVTLAGQLGKVADALDRIRNAPGNFSDVVARTLSSAGQWATQKAEQVERESPWYLRSAASLGMAPTAFAGYLAQGVAPLIGNTSQFTPSMFPLTRSNSVGGRPSAPPEAPTPDPDALKRAAEAAKKLREELDRITGRKVIADAEALGKHIRALGVQAIPTSSIEGFAKQLMAARDIARETGVETENIVRALNSLPIASRRIEGLNPLYVQGNISAAARAAEATAQRTTGSFAGFGGTINSTNPLSMAGLAPTITPGVVKVTQATNDWRASVRGVSQAFGTLAQIVGPSLDNVSRSLGTVMAASDAAFQLVESLSEQFKGLGDGKGGLSTGGRAVAGGVAGLTTGLALGSLFTNRAGGFVAGAAGGAVSGGLAGGGVGAGVGAVTGGLSGLFAANQNRKAQMQAVEQMRQQTIAAFGTVDDFRAAVERAGYSYDYFLQSFNSSSPATFTRAVNDLNAALAEQKKRADTLVKGLNEVARVQGVLSSQQIAQIRNMRPGDPGAEDVLAFAAGQRQQAENGLIRAVAALEAYGEAALDDFAVAAQGAASGLYVAFTEALEQGENAIDVLSRLGGSISVLESLFASRGITPGAGFASLQSLQSIVSGAQTGPAAQLGAGLGQALTGFANTGLLSPELFGELANGIGAAYKALEDLGQGGIDAARLFQPYLQSIDKLIRDNPELEAQLDDQTRALLDFARQAGIIGPKFDSSADRILSALDKLIGKLDEFIARMATASGIVIPTPGTPGTPGDPGNDPTPGGGGGEYPGFAGGTNGVRDFGRESIVALHGREAVLTEGQYASLQAQARMGVSSSPRMGGGITQIINTHLGREVISRAVAEDLPGLVNVYAGSGR
jgi:hypothetical protein